MSGAPTPENIPEAIDGELFRATVGSELHGVHVGGQEDHDEMGLVVEKPEYVVGTRTFEQYIHRTAGEGNRSGPDDTDLTLYSLRKFARLALNGNPSILVLFDVPGEFIIDTVSWFPDMLARMAAAATSKRAGRAFLGYMTQQRERMEGVRGGKHTNRPELIEKYGYDTKYAMHMLRLGFQGREYLTRGKITLPMHADARAYLVSVRLGQQTMEEVLRLGESLEADVKALLDQPGKSPLPDEPNREAMDRAVIGAYRRAWEWGG